MGEGTLIVDLFTPEKLFYTILGETSGFEIDGEDKLITLLIQLSEVKKKYDKVAYALNEVQQKGYGIVSPTIDELTLDEPEIVKQGNRFGVKLRASAPSIHVISKECTLKRSHNKSIKMQITVSLFIKSESGYF